MKYKGKILYLVTEDWYFCSHRLPLACAARDEGYEVVVVTRVTSHGDEIVRNGLKLIPMGMRRRGQNPLYELSSIIELIKIYRRERPDLVHHVALKPVIYGSLAALVTGVSSKVNALAGLGYVFSSDSLKARLLRPAVRLLFRGLLNRKNCQVILQNPDDIATLVEAKVLRAKNITLIRGSGVDLQIFSMVPESDAVPLVILASRMLWDKGVGEFIEAALHLQSAGVTARFVLVGESDPDNPSSISNAQLRQWHEEKGVEWWGRREQMAAVMQQSHIVCLPSYREGLPKVLLEAAASGRAIVTSDAPGCREIVKDGENGILVPIKQSGPLAEALGRLIADPLLRQQMGRRGRALVEAEFSSDQVIRETLALYSTLH